MQFHRLERFDITQEQCSVTNTLGRSGISQFIAVPIVPSQAERGEVDLNTLFVILMFPKACMLLCDALKVKPTYIYKSYLQNQRKPV